jgi:hypothetical protein
MDFPPNGRGQKIADKAWEQYCGWPGGMRLRLFRAVSVYLLASPLTPRGQRTCKHDLGRLPTARLHEKRLFRTIVELRNYLGSGRKATATTSRRNAGLIRIQAEKLDDCWVDLHRRLCLTVKYGTV